MDKQLRKIIDLADGYLKYYVAWIGNGIDRHPYWALLKMYGPIVIIPIFLITIYPHEEVESDLISPPSLEIADDETFLEIPDELLLAQIEACENVENPIFPFQEQSIEVESDWFVGRGVEEVIDGQRNYPIAERQAISELVSSIESSNPTIDDISIDILSNISEREATLIDNPCRIQITRYIAHIDIDTHFNRIQLNQQLHSQGQRFYELSLNGDLNSATIISYLSSAQNAWESLDYRYISDIQIAQIESDLPAIERQLEEFVIAERATLDAISNSVPLPSSQIEAQIELVNSLDLVPVDGKIDAINSLDILANEQGMLLESTRMLEIFQAANDSSISNAEAAIGTLSGIVTYPANQSAVDTYINTLRNRIENLWTAQLESDFETISSSTNAQNAINMIADWSYSYESLNLKDASVDRAELYAAANSLRNIESEANRTLRINSEFDSCDILINLDITDFQVNTTVYEESPRARFVTLDNIITDINLKNEDDTLNLVLNELTLNIRLNSDARSLFENQLAVNRRIGTSDSEPARFRSETSQNNSNVTLFEEVNECLAELSESNTQCSVTPTFSYAGTSRFGCQFEGSVEAGPVTYSSRHRRGDYTISKRLSTNVN